MSNRTTLANSTSAAPAVSLHAGVPIGKPANGMSKDLEIPAQWKTTPALLRMMLGGIWVLCAIFMLAALGGIKAHRHSMQTIGRDSAPSIIAAQHIRTCLADMHALLAQSWLKSGADAWKASRDYDQRRAEAAEQMVAAAENITYGDAERRPIRTLVTGLGSYEAEAAQARLLHSTGAADFAVHFHEADRLLHEDLLPASDALDQANLDALNAGYSDERAAADWSTAWTIATACLLLAALLAAQWILFRWMHRVFNPLLILATALTCGLLVSLVVGFQQEREQLRATKQDAFDSIYALWHAKACAYDANAAMLCNLVEPGLGQGRFFQNTTKLASVSSSPSLASVSDTVVGGNPLPDDFKGYLADELRNITFVGEKEAATDTLQTFVAYLQTCDNVQTQLRSGDTAAAKSAAVTNALPAFSRFDGALSRTLDINQQAFDASVPAGFAALNGLTAQTVIIVGMIAILAFLGFRPRLREYAQ